jgi:hypothetical protein
MTMLIPSRAQIIPKYAADDPFDAILRPPPDESPEDREIRLAREEEAKRVSQAIDDSIKAERQLRKKKRIVRLLLLGQSESGELIPSFWPLSSCVDPTNFARQINNATTSVFSHSIIARH